MFHLWLYVEVNTVFQGSTNVVLFNWQRHFMVTKISLMEFN
ncbi:hypothetical protein PCIT_b0454 [Pseudoalteromonas citrea]|uniref:Uncharacterized protein n=1 Tax=Pseudoalteromonas citrea TaxID=43655 RepID=A0AAD4AEF7_9GAMM|nr:hypothetical protein PCIT_b0454 [Pseudoalteromonas citrea]